MLSRNRLAAACLAALGFYVLSRMLGVLLAISASEFRSFSDLPSRGAETYAEVMSWLLPRLDQLAPSNWLATAPTLDGSVTLLFAQALVYCGLMVLAAAFDFARRRF
jgi:hypothetical protein